MDIDQAAKITWKLADGVDSTIGEQLPPSSVYKQSDTLKRLTIALTLLVCLLTGTASAVIQSPLQGGPARLSWEPIFPAVSPASSFLYFNELTCRNNPMEGTDPYGLMTRHYRDDGNTCLMTGSYGDRLLFQKIRGEWVLVKEDIGELDTGFFNAGYAEGMQGGASIVANTVSFGGSDNLGWTESAQYQGTEFEISRGLAYGSRDLAMTAVGMGVVSKASKTATVANFVARNATAVNKVRTVAAVVGSFGTGVEAGTAGYAFYEGDYQTGIRSSMRVGSDLALTMFVKPKPAAKSPSQVLQNQAAGNIARDNIAASRPGSLIEQNFRVTGGLRRVDVLNGATAIESKLGRTSLTRAVRQELARDIKLMRSGQVEGLEWHFAPSPTTGLGGPSGPLRAKLDKFGIPIVE